MITWIHINDFNITHYFSPFAGWACHFAAPVAQSFRCLRGRHWGCRQQKSFGVHPPKKVDFTQHKFEKFTIWSDMISGGLSRGFVIKIWSLAGYKCTFLVQKYWTLYTQHRQFQTNPRMTGTIGHGGVWISMTFGGMGLLVRSIPTYTQPWYTNNSP